MSTPVQASRQFKADFDAVCRKYNCTPEEVEIMKTLARADMPAAVESFGLMAKECNGDQQKTA